MTPAHPVAPAASTGSSTPPVLAIPGLDNDLAARLQDGLDRVDALLRESVDHDDPFIAGAGGHLIEAGGKRFRPLLTLLAASAVGEITDEVVTAAAGVELTHLASLYHDDVMDEAAVRRGVPSVNAAYDNSTAILVGDLLFGQASELISRLGAEAVRIQARTFVRLCTGQIHDDHPCPPGQDPVEYYMGVMADKTGVLIGTAARYGAMFGGATPQQVAALTAYGEQVGIAFQLADDLIDIASEGEQTGKTPGTDLREGVDTLAVLHVRASTDPAVTQSADHRRLLELLDRDLSDDDEGVAEALRLLRAHPALERARARTLEVALEAQALVADLPAGPARDALQALPLSVVQRAG